MEYLKFALAICDLILCFVILGFICDLIKVIWNRIFKKQKIGIKEIFPFSVFVEIKNGDKNLSVFHVIVSLAVIAGIVNNILSYTLASEQIGAFYEKSEYKADYEAVAYVGDKPIFCIVTVAKYGKDDYRIIEEKMPYGFTAYDDAQYEIEKGYVNTFIGEYGTKCKIVLKDLATRDSYKLLDNTVITNHGPLCGSVNSKKYHWLECPNAQNIEEKNLIYFDNSAEADVLGYTLCQFCEETYGTFW